MSLLWLLAASPIAAQVPGSLEPLNLDIVGNGVFASAVQPDGKTVIGGNFSSVLGQPRSNIARINADGTLDAGFSPSANLQVLSILLQGDGKILIGGSFTSVAGSTRNRLARLEADGTIDTGFNPNPSGPVLAMAMQADDKILIGGSFTSVAGSLRNRLARINPDGTLDTGFDPNVNSEVQSVLVQPDGKTVLGGGFTGVGGTARNRIARLNVDGTLDTGFNPNVSSGLAVYSLLLQADGKIVLGGNFSGVAGTSRNRIARVSSTGALDAGFNANLVGVNVLGMALQADGKILLGGNFSTVGGVARNRVARLQADGSLDAGFDPDADSDVYSISLQADGKILLGGLFTQVGGTARNRFARLSNDPAMQTLAVVDPTQFTWARSGSAPDLSAVSFALSTDGGNSYTPLTGIATRVGASGDWQFSGFNLPGDGMIRALGRDGFGLVEQRTAFQLPTVTPSNNNLSSTATTLTINGSNFSTTPAENAVAFTPSGSGTVTASTTTTLTVTSLSNLNLGPLNAVVTTAGKTSGAPVQIATVVIPAAGVVDMLDIGIVGSEIRATAVQTDGKTIIAGVFTSVLGQARNNIARLNADGSLDAGFDPNVVGAAIVNVAVQTDGKVLIGGAITSVDGTARSNIARLNADGSLDSSFNPNANGFVLALAVQGDGRILLGGQFSAVGGAARSRIARLDADGSLDASFDPLASVNNNVSSLAVDDAGRILLAGSFTLVNGSPRNRVARLNADGTLDSGFDPNANSTIFTLALQADGKILLGGIFTQVGGIARSYVARLNADGTADATFNRSANAQVFSIAVQADGRILLGGLFTTLGGTARNRIARLNADSTLDTGFNPNSNNQVSSISLQADGSILLGGTFTSIGTMARNRFARLFNDPAFQTLGAQSSSVLLWTRDGGAPDVSQVSFELSTDGGSSYAPLLGTSARVAGTANWQLSGLSLPVSGHLRARGRNIGGNYDASSGLVEQVASFDRSPTITASTFVRLRTASTVVIQGNYFSTTPANNSVAFTPTGAGTVTASTATTLTVTGVSGLSLGALYAVVTSEGLSSGTPVQVATVVEPVPGDLEPLNLDIVGDRVYAAVTQADGKLLVAGQFTSVLGQARSNIARIAADGTLDLGFDPGADNAIYNLAVQNDGKILLGGSFTAVAGATRNRIARLNSDGTLDASFNPTANQDINALALQADGKILLGGLFTAIGASTRNHVARLNADGSLDAGFDPNANNEVSSLAVQADGRILLGGSFTTVAGIGRNRIARVTANGALDSSFDPGANDAVSALAVQADGKILAGGLFTNVGGTARFLIVRIDSDGSLDSSFNPSLDGPPLSVALQADGKILLGGNFNNVGGTQRSKVARLNADGTLDTGYVPYANRLVHSVGLQADGTVMLGGEFDFVGSETRNRFARLVNDPGSQSLSIVDSTQILWTRMGSAPDITQPSIELSTDGGSSYTLLVATPTRINGSANWLLGGLNLPASGQLRVRGRTLGGNYNGSSGSVEASLSFSGLLPRPVVSSVDPATGIIAGGTAITISGSGFTGASAVMIGGSPATDVVVVDDSSITATTPAGAAGSASVEVIALGGSSAPNTLYTYVTSGSVDTLDPAMVGNFALAMAEQPDGKILIAGSFTTMLGQGRRGIARLNADGTLDAGFNPDVNGTVFSVALQANGQILIGGGFTTVGAIARTRIARLNANGSLDTSFDPNLNNTVYSLALQPDGKLLLAGSFISVDGIARNRIARLAEDGSLDASFNPGADNIVYSLAPQPDGNILMTGSFTTVAATVRNRVARLYPDGTLDLGFDPNANGLVEAVAIQPDGRILLGGDFTDLGGNPVNRVARLAMDGTLDTSFNPNANGAVRTLAIQSDERILIGGSFTSVGGSTRNHIARVLADGGLDATFDPDAGNNVGGIMLQANGQILIGGLFTTVGGAARNHFARLYNGTATQSLVATDTGQLSWTRGGSAPDLSQTDFELSTDGGNSYTALGGTPTRVGNSASWQLTGLSLPASGQIRARGVNAGGVYTGSSGLVEQVASFAFPQLTIDDVAIAEGDSGTSQLNFTVTRNGATANPVDFSFSTADGSASAGSDYVASSGTGSIAAGGPSASTTIAVTINGDTLFEGDETFFVILSAPSANALIADSQGLGTIVNDDAEVFTVSPSAGTNGSIAPTTPQSITAGATTSFTLSPDSGYSASVGGTCGGALIGNTYTTNPIDANCTVIASFFIPPSGTAGLSVGSITLPATTSGPNAATRVNFPQAFDSTPVVIVQADDDDADPQSLRISGVDTTGFHVLQVEAPGCIGCTGAGGAMSVHWLAAVPGSYRLPDEVARSSRVPGAGVLVKVGSVSTEANQRATGYGGFAGWAPTSWESVAFPSVSGFDFSSAPVVLSTIQSWNGANEGSNLVLAPQPSLTGTSQLWLTSVLSNVTANRFDAALESSSVDDNGSATAGLAAPETIGWIAIESDISTQLATTGGVGLIGMATALGSATGGCTDTAMSFPSNTTITPSNLRGFVSKQSRNEADGGWVRTCALTNPSDTNVTISARIDEDQDLKADRGHPGSEALGAAMFSGDFSTTPISLAFLQSTRSGSRIDISFQSAVEISHLGYRIWGRENPTRQWRKLHPELMTSVGGDSMQARSYQRSLEAPGITELRIEDVDILGQSRFHPASAVGARVGAPVIDEPLDWNAVRAANASHPVHINRGTGAARVVADVKMAGIQRVSFDDLLAAGFPSGASAGDIAIRDESGPIARYIDCPGSTFVSGCHVEWLGQTRSNLHGSAKAYLIAVDAASAVDVGSARVANGSVRTVLRRRSAAPNRSYTFAAPGNDPWYDQGLQATSAPASLSRTFTLPGRSAGPVQLRVELWGGINYPGSAPDHSTELLLNGQLIDSRRFDGLVASTVMVDLPENLIGASNTLTVRLPADTGFAADLVLLDGYHLDYLGSTTLSDGELRFGQFPTSTAAKVGQDEIFAHGFETRPGMLIEGINAPTTLWTMIGGQQFRDRSSIAIALDDAVEALIAATDAHVQQPELRAAATEPVIPGSSDYLIISHPQFVDQLQALVNLQQGRGYSVAVMRTDEIYAGYSFHQRSPDAIAAVIDQIAPRFVLLVGGDSYDYDDNLGLGSMSFVPTFYRSASSIARFAPSDLRYADHDGDGAPDRALGRLPVRTNLELERAINSILARGNSPTGSFFASAGGSNESEHFGTHSRSLLSYLRQGQPRSYALIDEIGLSTARTATTGALAGAADWINYVGHSSPNRWDFQNLLTTGSLASISRSGMPAIVSQWGCWNNYFVLPGQDTMSHALMLRENQLAALVIGSTSLSEDASHLALALRFFDLIEDGRIGDRPGAAINTVGEALQAAARDLKLRAPQHLESNYSISLFGDPATPIR
ncbi:MAG: C25 family cysteine peptidase [Lysobacterales bacterium]